VNIHDLVRREKTKIILAGAAYEIISDDMKRFHVENATRHCFVSCDLFSASFLVVAASERETRRR